MTVAEKLKSVLVFDVSDTRIEGALIDADLDGNNEYTKDLKSQVDAVAVEVLQDLLITPNVSEGGLSISYDRAAIKERIQFLTTGASAGITARPW